MFSQAFKCTCTGLSFATWFLIVETWKVLFLYEFLGQCVVQQKPCWKYYRNCTGWEDGITETWPPPCWPWLPLRTGEGRVFCWSGQFWVCSTAPIFVGCGNWWMDKHLQNVCHEAGLSFNYTSSTSFYLPFPVGLRNLSADAVILVDNISFSSLVGCPSPPVLSLHPGSLATAAFSHSS